MVDITIREAVIEDAPALLYINQTSLGYDFSLKETSNQLAKIIDSNFYKLYVAEYQGKVVGYIQGSNYDCIYSESLKDIIALSVDLEYTNKGIGKQLLEHLEKWAKEDGAEGVRLVSSERRVDAHRFYINNGYTSNKLQKNFIKLFEEQS